VNSTAITALIAVAPTGSVVRVFPRLLSMRPANHMGLVTA
jgi:hypothetical protein